MLEQITEQPPCGATRQSRQDKRGRHQSPPVQIETLEQRHVRARPRLRKGLQSVVCLYPECDVTRGSQPRARALCLV